MTVGSIFGFVSLQHTALGVSAVIRYRMPICNRGVQMLKDGEGTCCMSNHCIQSASHILEETILHGCRTCSYVQDAPYATVFTWV